MKGTKRQQYDGLWWTPSAPNDEVIGTLTIDPNGHTDLSLRYKSSEAPEQSLPAILNSLNPFEPNEMNLTILGQASGGKLFTLHDGWVTNSGLNMGSLKVATVHFNRVFEGVCCDQPSALPVKFAFATYPGSYGWLNARPYKVTFGPDSSATIASQLPADESLQIDGNRRLLIQWRLEGLSESLYDKPSGMYARPWLGLEYDSPVTPEVVSDDLNSIAQLLSLFLGVPTTPRETRLRSPDSTSHVGEKDQFNSIRMFGTGFRLPQSFRRWSIHDVLIPFSAIQDQIGSLVQKWFKIRHDCWGAIVPYFAAQRSPAPMADTRFFDFAASAESFHSHFRPDEKAFSDEEARDIREAIVPCVPQVYRSAVSDVLRRVNALTYKQRLKRLLLRFPALMLDVVGDTKQQSAFCKLVKELRNREAHRLTRTDETNVGGLKLVRIASKLKVILDAWILAEIGVPDQIIEQRMRKNYRYWFYASNTTWPWDIPNGS